jgi:hypothetical protein
MTPRPSTFEEVRALIDEIIEYAWADEMAHYQENRYDMEDPNGHIFAKLVRLNNWVQGINEDPDVLIDWLPEEETQ